MKRIFVIAVLLLASLGLYAQTQDDITLVVSGQGGTKEEATANALRSAIEQAYGVFVSANTQILNDDVVKDEIATVASGNVKSYEELSCMAMADGSMSVTLSATVSIGNLITYAKSHGSSAEFAGQTFAMNMKMRKLNTENEYKALLALEEQVSMLARHCFDYEIEKVGEPKVVTNIRNICLRNVLDYSKKKNRILSVLGDALSPYVFDNFEDYVSAKSDLCYPDYGFRLYVNIDKLEQMGIRIIESNPYYTRYEYEYERDGVKYKEYGTIKESNNGDVYYEVVSDCLKLPELYSVDLEIKAVPNDNFKKVDSLIIKTLEILSLSQEEQEAWNKNNMQTYKVVWDFDGYDKYLQKNFQISTNDEIGYNRQKYVLRSSHSGEIMDDIFDIFNMAACSWELDVKGLNFYYPNIKRIFERYKRRSISILLCGRRDIKEIYIAPYLIAEHCDKEKRFTILNSDVTYESIQDLSQIVEFHFFEQSLYSVQGFDIKFYPELYEQGLRIINDRREK